MKKVLMVDTSTSRSVYKSFFPLGLLKLSTYYKKKGYMVNAVIGNKINKNFIPDIICFSPVFLFKIKDDIKVILGYKNKFPNAKIRIGGITATLKPDFFKKYIKGCDVYEGIYEEIEYNEPDYKLVNKDFSYGFTSRGCTNKCKWCVVPKTEGNMKINDKWTNNLGKGHKLFLGMDNNILATGSDRFELILKEIYKRKMKIDFNQGMDCRLFAKNEMFAKLMGEYKVFDTVRFAWDSKAQDKYVDKTIELIKKYKVTAKAFTWYVLYGNGENPKEIRNRIIKLTKEFHKVKLMRFKDLETGQKSRGYADYLELMVSSISITGLITNDLIPYFGKDPKEFEKIMYYIKGNRNKLQKRIGGNLNVKTKFDFIKMAIGE